MLRNVVATLSVAALLWLVACGTEGLDDFTQQPSQAVQEKESDVNSTKQLLEGIETKLEPQAVWNVKGQQKVVFWVRNNTDKTFNGTGELWIVGVSKKDTRHFTRVYVDNLGAGLQSYKILWIEPNKLSDAGYTLKWISAEFK